MKRWAPAVLLILAACAAPQDPAKPPTGPNAAGLVALSCDRDASVYPVNRVYCLGQRRYVTPAAMQSLESAAKLSKAYPDARPGFSGSGKVRFAGCQAARHDDHIHVDFY